MPTTTVLNEDTATIVTDGESSRRFSWSAAVAGALVATAVTLFLLTLGSGVGLSLVSVRNATQDSTVTFLTLGAIYFLVAQAFGFAAGGHIVGRLIGPAVETTRDEEWRAGTHALVAWALAVTLTAALVTLSTVVTGSATLGALAATSAGGARSVDNQTILTSYWVDTLFRPAGSASAASLAWRQYAQVDTGTATDATTTASDSIITPAESAAMTATPPDTTAPPRSPTVFLESATTTATPVSPATTPTRSLAADKAEAGRILTVGMAKGGIPSSDDRAQLATLVARDTGLTAGEAQRRVMDTVKRIRAEELRAAELARKTAAYVALWSAFALLFGAVVAVAAAISARWEDDREHGILPGTIVSQTRF